MLPAAELENDLHDNKQQISDEVGVKQLVLACIEVNLYCRCFCILPHCTCMLSLYCTGLQIVSI